MPHRNSFGQFIGEGAQQQGIILREAARQNQEFRVEKAYEGCAPDRQIFCVSLNRLAGYKISRVCRLDDLLRRG